MSTRTIGYKTIITRIDTLSLPFLEHKFKNVLLVSRFKDGKSALSSV